MQIHSHTNSGGGVGGVEAAACSSSSSIGKASESVRFGSGGPGEAEEVQSAYKGPLGALHSLEESLPFRRGISRFYDGRSKSFCNLISTSLSPTNSCKDLAKTENPYTRKRKNLLAFSLMYQQKEPTEKTACNSDSESNASELEEEEEERKIVQTPLKRVKNGVPVFSMHQRSVSLTDCGVN